jgi:hypothetical protein
MSWDTPLSDPVVIKSGEGQTETLRTLRDVGDHLVKVYSTRRGGVIEALIEALLKASKDPRPINIDRATDAAERFFAWESELISPIKVRVPGEADLYQRLAAMMAVKPAEGSPGVPRRRR